MNETKHCAKVHYVKPILFLEKHGLFKAEFEKLCQARHTDADVPEHSEYERVAKFPNNLTLQEYTWFLIVPTLVYEFDYPRTKRIRLAYLFEKAITGVGVFSILHIITERYISPVLEKCSDMSTPDGKSLVHFPPRILSMISLIFLKIGLTLTFIIFLEKR